MDESQVSGSASTYGRKYALQNLLMISDDVDPDSLDNSKEGLPNPKKATKTQLEALKKHSNEIAQLAKLEGIAFFEQITEKKFGQSVDINKINTEQLTTLNRYLNELEKYYKGKK